MKKVKKLSIKQSDGNMSEALPIGVDASNVDMQDGSNAETAIKTMQDKLKTISPGANAYVLPVAAEELGGIKNGGDLNIGEDGTVEVKDNSHNHEIKNVTGLQGELDKKVPNTRKVNGKELKSDIVLTSQDVQAIPASEKGEPNGVATLDEEGQIPAAQLPSFVDNIWEGYLYEGQFYEDEAHEHPIEHQANHIYVDKHTNKTYRWSGSQFTEISPSLALGTTANTAFRGDYGNAAYKHSQAKGIEKEEGFYKITTNAEGHIIAVSEVTLDDLIGLGVINAQASDTAPKTPQNTAAAGEEDKWARGDHVHPVQKDVTGNAGTATKLAQGQNLKVDLTSSEAQLFDGTQAVENIGVSGILPIANGGTGTTDLSKLVTGKSNQITSNKLTSEDLNTLVGTNYFGKVYYALSGNTTTNCPTGFNDTSYSLKLYQVGETNETLQVATNGKAEVYIRTVGTEVEAWKRVYNDDYHPVILPVNPVDTSGINIWISDE